MKKFLTALLVMTSVSSFASVHKNLELNLNLSQELQSYLEGAKATLMYESTVNSSSCVNRLVHRIPEIFERNVVLDLSGDPVVLSGSINKCKAKLTNHLTIKLAKDKDVAHTFIVEDTMFGAEIHKTPVASLPVILVETKNASETNELRCKLSAPYSAFRSSKAKRDLTCDNSDQNGNSRAAIKYGQDGKVNIDIVIAE
jgi:hypothetical protein